MSEPPTTLDALILRNGLRSRLEAQFELAGWPASQIPALPGHLGLRS